MNSSIATADGSDALPAVLVSLKSDPSCHRMFRPGQPLTAEGVLPNQLLLILEGGAVWPSPFTPPWPAGTLTDVWHANSLADGIELTKCQRASTMNNKYKEITDFICRI